MIIGIEANHANKEQRTGVENYCWHIINNLKKQIPSDVRVILYTQKPLLPELAQGLPLNWEIKILTWPLGKLWSQIRLSFELFKNKPDIFFAPGQLIPFFCPQKTVVTVHDSAFMIFPTSYRFWGRQYLKWMNKRIVKKAMFILTPSEFSKKEFKKLYNFAEDKIIVTPLGYEKEVYNTTNQEISERILENLNIRKPFIFYVGRLEYKKNIVSILESFEQIKKENKFFGQLVLGGKPGYGYEKIKKIIEQSNFKEDIVLPGWLSNKQIVVCFQKAEFFVFPSLYEGFGLPLLEAMACGCPIVAAKGHSLEEVGGDAVEYFDFKNKSELTEKLNFLLSDKNRIIWLKQRGLQRVQQYSWEKTAIYTKDLFLRLQNS